MSSPQRTASSSGSTATAPERPFKLCSLVSEASGEDPIGSAWSTPRYILIELALPWPYSFLEGSNIPSGLKELIYDEWYAAGNYWGVVGMAPDDTYSIPGSVRVIDHRLPDAPFRGYERDEYLVPAEQLVPMLRVMGNDPVSAELDSFRQAPSATRDLLVCTHGSIDACCAKFGYPVYRQLRQIAAESPKPVRVWRCTHFGGHRFAATLLDMPEGRYWGHLKPQHLSQIVNRDVPVADLRRCYRGWAALSHPLQQVAEGAAFVRGDWAWTECAVTPGDAPDAAGPDSATITFAYEHHERNERGEIAVEVIPAGTVTTQNSSNKPEPHEATQYETVVRHVAPEDGLLA